MRQRSAKQTHLTRILKASDKGENQTPGLKGTLASAFRTYLKLLEINEPRWNMCLKRYIRNYENQSSSKEKSSIGSNLTKALYAREMTWITFLRGLSFLGFVRGTITIKAYDAKGDEVIVTKGFNLTDHHVKFDEEIKENKEEK